jgi:hypothetical protein
VIENLKARDIDSGNMILQLDEIIRQAVVDIADQNKKATKPRVVTLTLTFAPSKSRREAEASYQVTLKPSHHVDREKSIIHIGKDEKGNPIAATYIPSQQVLPGVETAFHAREDEDDADAAH